MNNNNDERCCDCEIFKNYELKENSFAFGFFCPIKSLFVGRDEMACDNILSDNLPF